MQAELATLTKQSLPEYGQSHSAHLVAWMSPVVLFIGFQAKTEKTEIYSCMAHVALFFERTAVKSLHA